MLEVIISGCRLTTNMCIGLEKIVKTIDCTIKVNPKFTAIYLTFEVVDLCYRQPDLCSRNMWHVLQAYPGEQRHVFPVPEDQPGDQFYYGPQSEQSFGVPGAFSMPPNAGSGFGAGAAQEGAAPPSAGGLHGSRNKR